MLGKYVATKDDLRAIDEALRYVWHSRMNFVFDDKDKIKDVPVISYDAKNLYLWSNQNFPDLEKIPNNFKKYTLHKIAHNLKKIPEKWQRGWFSGIRIKKIKEILFKKTKKYLDGPSGSFLTPFIKSHPLDPYHTYESYLATIIHEFGHVYWNAHKLWWYSDKKKNLDYLYAAFDLYKGKKRNSLPSLYFSSKNEISELFAFCTEYFASSIFWPNYKKNLDRYILTILNNLVKQEKTKDLDSEDSVIEITKHPHDFSFVFGKIILEKYPTNWPSLLVHNLQQIF